LTEKRLIKSKNNLPCAVFSAERCDVDPSIIKNGFTIDTRKIIGVGESYEVFCKPDFTQSDNGNEQINVYCNEKGRLSKTTQGLTKLPACIEGIVCTKLF